MSGGKAPRRRRREEPPARPPRFTLRRYALPIAFVAAVVALTWFIVTAVRLVSPAGDVVTVPSFVGMQYSDAGAAANAARIGLRIVARKPDFHAPKDQIVGQLPAAGEHVRVGRVVDVVVSDGRPSAKVPNVANMSVRDATVTLENARLDLGHVTTRFDADVAEGTVLDQKPDALTDVPAGMKVDVVIAAGRPVLYAPNFVGMSLNAATTAAQEARVPLLSPVQLAIAPSAPPKGVVVSQDPPAGEQLKPHQAITLQLSGGPAPTMPPTPGADGSMPASGASPSSAMSPSPSQTGLLPSPEAPRGLRVSVALPASASPVRIRVVLLDATGTRSLYDQQTKGGFTLSFDITVTGAGTLQTYVGDTLVNSTPL